MIERKDLFSMPFYKKTHFSGSYLGMRYRIEKKDQDGDTVFLVTVFPGPYCYDATSDEKKETKTFPFTDDGLNQICDWLNETYSADPDRFKPGMVIY